MQENRDLLLTLSLAERKILNYFKTKNLIKVEETQLFQSGEFKTENEIRSAAGYLQKKRLIEIIFHSEKFVRILPEGKKYIESDFPEVQLLKLLSENDGQFEIESIGKKGLFSEEEQKIAIIWIKKFGWAEIKNINGKKRLIISNEGKEYLKKRSGGEIPKGHRYYYELMLRAINNSKDGNIKNIAHVTDNLEYYKILKQRNLVEEYEKKRQEYILTENGIHLLNEIPTIEHKAELVELTPEILQTGIWKNATFRKYRIEDVSKKVYIGKLHPLTHLIEKIRKVFFAMGFKEITSDYVRPMFWNMDALFVPQDHPARDAQDTFYVTNPDRIKTDNVQLVEKIARIHQNGGDTGSDGWGYPWSKDEGEKACLKTHTTADTIEYLAEHPFAPQKIFIIDTVFRVDKIDRTHLPQFTQIEGIVVEENANIPMLIGVVKEFYRRIGFENVKVKPVYYPFTEPSVHFYTELPDGYILELGGSGIFRPEVTLPLGIKEPVLAWGLGLERLAMNIFGMDSIQDLYLSDIQWLREFVMR